MPNRVIRVGELYYSNYDNNFSMCLIEQLETNFKLHKLICLISRGDTLKCDLHSLYNNTFWKKCPI